MGMNEWLSGCMFKAVHGNNLVYNTCWEDPRLDRKAMTLTPDDDVLVITSAGCNALDYVLAGPRSVHAVDMNPRQNALLELKLAAIGRLEFDDFFQMFGEGRIRGARQLYQQVLRSELSPWSQEYWDRWIKFFDNPRRPFYFRGTSGGFARLINLYIDRVACIRPIIDRLLEAPSVEMQRQIYESELHDRFWTRSMRFAMGRDTTLSLVGVPRAQRKQVEKDYEGGIVKFIQDCMESVFARLPIRDNYFWRVYITGQYTPDCCPEYLRPECFQRLKEGLADRVHVHTDSVEGFLRSSDQTFSRYVLLDHMDWLSTYRFHLLESEWQAILDRARPSARILWRSGGLKTDFVDRVHVMVDGKRRALPEILQYHRDLAAELHQVDRVHTYGSFYIADLAA